MAEIFLARATTELGAARLCVVKQIIAEFANHPQFAEMLIHEAKLAARLNHAHIVQVFDLGRADENLYIAMEYVEGFDLNALLRLCSGAKVPLPFEFALGIVSDVLKGLDYAHRRTDDAGRPLGIVHRDVSPSNILISLEGEVKLCDFGIAHANDLVQQTGLQIDEAIKGKAGYMSPEHARGEPIDARADVFAAGIVLWELLAGRRMYKKEEAASLLDVARRAEIPPLPKKDLPHEEKLHAIVGKALATKREDRYPSANALLRDLSGYMSDAKLVASPLKLGTWVVDHFGSEVVGRRKLGEGLTPVPSLAAMAVPSLAAMAGPSLAAKAGVHSEPPPPSAPNVASASSSIARITPNARVTNGAHARGHTASDDARSSGPSSDAPRSSGGPLSLGPLSPASLGSSDLTKTPLKAPDHDPPSLAAATVDVVPSSDTLPIMPARAPRRNTRAIVLAVLALVILVIAGALFAMR